MEDVISGIRRTRNGGRSEFNTAPAPDPATSQVFYENEGDGVSGAGTGRKVRYTQASMLDSNRMHATRFRRGYWDALYDLWRLSWFECGSSETVGGWGPSVPRPVSLTHWLSGISATDRTMTRIYEIPDAQDAQAAGRHNTPPEPTTAEFSSGGTAAITAEFLTSAQDSQLTRPERLAWLCQLNIDWRPLDLAPPELVHLAGAMQRAELITSRFMPTSAARPPAPDARPHPNDRRDRDRHPPFEIVYFVDARVALQIQHFLANWVVDQDLRPGPPGCVDQYSAITMGDYKKFVYSGRFAPMMAIRHQALAAEAIGHTVDAMEIEYKAEQHHASHEKEVQAEAPTPPDAS